MTPVVTLKTIGLNGLDPDLLVCVGRVRLIDALIKFKVNISGYVGSVGIHGLAEDLYDFDIAGEEQLGLPARRAARVQAGFPTLRDGGKVFKTVIDLGGGNPYENHELTPYIFINS